MGGRGKERKEAKCSRMKEKAREYEATIKRIEQIQIFLLARFKKYSCEHNLCYFNRKRHLEKGQKRLRMEKRLFFAQKKTWSMN